MVSARGFLRASSRSPLQKKQVALVTVSGEAPGFGVSVGFSFPPSAEIQTRPTIYLGAGEDACRPPVKVTTWQLYCTSSTSLLYSQYARVRVRANGGRLCELSIFRRELSRSIWLGQRPEFSLARINSKERGSQLLLPNPVGRKFLWGRFHPALYSAEKHTTNRN